MKTKIYPLLLALMLIGASCEKNDLLPVDKQQGKEQVKEDTPESILIGVQNKYTYDSYSKTNTDYTVVFHDPQSIKLIQNYPDGIERVTIKKSEISSWKDNASNVDIKFKSGKTATLNKYTLLVVNYSDLDPISFNSAGESKTINFTVEKNTEKNLTVTAESSNPGFTASVSMNNDKTGGFVIITNNTSNEKDATIHLLADNGVGRKENTVSVSFENFYFVQKPEWNPWNEPDTRIDGKSEIELDFDVELARKFVLTVNKGDLGITTSVSSDAKSWLSTKTLVNENGNGTQTVQVEISMTKNAGNQYRTGIVTVKSSKGKELKAEIRQIGEKMANSMRSSLMAFYNACNGSNWDDKTGWGTNAEIVDWYGISCLGYAKGNNNKVYSGLYDEWIIEMESNNISGNIPEAFWNIVNKFQTIDLGYNKFAEQKLDERIWHSHLRKLNLASCFAFTGGISPKIENCKKFLYYLQLSDNKLSAQIPEELYDCSELILLELGNLYIGSCNFYDCQISNKISNLKKLEELQINRAGIKGNLPNSFYELKNATVIWLGTNYITGQLNKNIIKLENLVNFDISGNNLTGEIPEEICFTDWLAPICNHLTGVLPEGIRYTKNSWDLDELWLAAAQNYSGAPRNIRDDGTNAGYSRNELCYYLPMPDWAKERFGVTQWNKINFEYNSKYPYADDLQYPANEYYYDGKDWRHPKYEHPARFYHKVNGEWTYDPGWNWNHTTDPPITEVPEWPGVNR